MSITETFHFDKGGNVEKNPLFKRFFLTLIIVLVALLSFGVGRLTGESWEGVRVDFNPELLNGGMNSKEEGPQSMRAGEVTASVNGTRYYYPHCGNSISEKNKVVFATSLIAEEAGYTLASGCKAK